MHFLTMFACSLPPISYRSFIQSECLDNCLDWTSVCLQRYHLQHNLWLRSQPVENRPFRYCKCLLAYSAYVALIFLTVFANVSFSNFALLPGSQYSGKIYPWGSWVFLLASSTMSLPLNPFFCKDLHQTTIKWGDTGVATPPQKYTNSSVLRSKDDLPEGFTLAISGGA